MCSLKSWMPARWYMECSKIQTVTRSNALTSANVIPFLLPTLISKRRKKVAQWQSLLLLFLLSYLYLTTFWPLLKKRKEGVVRLHSACSPTVYAIWFASLNLTHQNALIINFSSFLIAGTQREQRTVFTFVYNWFTWGVLVGHGVTYNSRVCFNLCAPVIQSKLKPLWFTD